MVTDLLYLLVLDHVWDFLKVNFVQERILTLKVFDVDVRNKRIRLVGLGRDLHTLVALNRGSRSIASLEI